MVCSFLNVPQLGRIIIVGRVLIKDGIIVDVCSDKLVVFSNTVISILGFHVNHSCDGMESPPDST